MLYSRHITVLTTHTEAAPSRTYVKVNRGWIYWMWITFPAGCAGLTKLRIYHEGHPFVPIEKDAYINGDNYTFSFPVYFPIKEEPQLLTIEAWNDDDTHSHSVQIIILILPKQYIMPIGATEGIMESLKSLILHPIIIKQEAEVVTE